MNILIVILSVLVALEFFFIMYLETFATTSSRTAETFSMSKNDLQNEKINTLLKIKVFITVLLALEYFIC